MQSWCGCLTCNKLRYWIRRTNMVRTAWHDLTTEETLEPALPICDPHHHFWHGGPRNRERYLLDELLRDIGSGHHIVSTVFMDCVSMYRKDGPDEMKPIRETH